MGDVVLVTIRNKSGSRIVDWPHLDIVHCTLHLWSYRADRLPVGSDTSTRTLLRQLRTRIAWRPTRPDSVIHNARNAEVHSGHAHNVCDVNIRRCRSFLSKETKIESDF